MLAPRLKESAGFSSTLLMQFMVLAGSIYSVFMVLYTLLLLETGFPVVNN